MLTAAMGILQRRGIAATCTIVGGSAFGNSRRTRYVKSSKGRGPAIRSLSAIEPVMSLRLCSGRRISSAALLSGTIPFP